MLKPKDAAPTKAPAKRKSAAVTKKAAVPATKMETLLAMLRRPEGVTCAEAAEATGWKPHTVRARLGSDVARKMGVPMTREVEDGRGRVYRAA